MIFAIQWDVWLGKGGGNSTLGGKNVCSTMRTQHFYPINESTKLRSVHRGLAKERNIDIRETKCVNFGHEIVQALASSSIFEAGESGENSTFPWRRRQAKVVSAGGNGKEME